MLELFFSSKLNWDYYAVSIAKTAFMKIGTLIYFRKFLSPRVTTYLHKYLKCGLVWNTIAMSGPMLLSICFLDMLDKLQKQVCKIHGPSLAASLGTLAHHRRVVSQCLFYSYYFVRCLPELVKLVLIPSFCGSSNRYSSVKTAWFFSHHFTMF